ncbi:MAG: hypothetical protein MUF54_11285 [Polyangiaceae bacterium]|nr:hypothetical protein [Polyangiaceae bacterium]
MDDTRIGVGHQRGIASGLRLGIDLDVGIACIGVGATGAAFTDRAAGAAIG